MQLNRVMGWIQQHLGTESQQLAAELKLIRKPLRPVSAVSLPALMAHTRFPLEKLREVDLTGYMPGLGDPARSSVEEAFKDLIVEHVYRSTFPMKDLHGCFASKAMFDPERSSTRSMAEMGSLVQLNDLKNKHGDEIVAACKEWGQVRLEEGIRLLTDSWHRRFYWQNEGGSHHMAVLCYELQRQKKEWRPEVQVTEYGINFRALASLSELTSVYVVTHEPGKFGWEQVFEPLPYRRGRSEMRDRFGLEVVRPGEYLGQLSEYDLVIVDHSKKHASLALRYMNEAVLSGFAMTFAKFLEDAMGLNDSRKPIRPSKQVAEIG